MPTAKQRPIRILIAEHHAVVREGIRLLLEKRAGMEVVGEAGDCHATVALAEREQPDVILLGLEMGPLQSSLDCFPQLQAVTPKARILVFTGVLNTELHLRAVQLGAVGLVLKDCSSDTLIKAIERVHAGEAWLDHKMTANVISEISRNNRKQTIDPEQVKIATLTQREREVATLLGEGFKTQEIAGRLYISKITVRNHIASIYSKLEVANRFELTLLLLRNKLAKTAKRSE